MRRQTNKLILLLTFVLLPQVYIAGAIEYPVLTEHVTDNAGIINAEYRQKITELATKIENESTVEIAILTIASLQGEDAGKYATAVGQISGIGKKYRNSGLLILIAMDDGKGNGQGAYFVATGSGLGTVLPDEIVKKVNDNILLPYLKKGKGTGDITYYGQGIYEEMLAFEDYFNSEIAYDDGSLEGAWSMGSGNPFLPSNDGGTRGQAVRFTPSSNFQNIDTIKIYGWRYGEDRIVRIEIWDSNKNILYKKISSHSDYFTTNKSWAYITVPGIKVSGDFYVVIFACSVDDILNPTTGVFIGYDNSSSIDRSYIVDNNVFTWGLNTPQETTNWMIRVAKNVDTTPSDILYYYRGLGQYPSIVETNDLLKAADD